MHASKRVSYAPLILIALALLVAGSLIGPSFQAFSPSRPSLTRQPATGPLPQLGFDCGLGTKEAVVNSSGYPVTASENGAFGLRSGCNWIGDVGQTALTTYDGTNEPMVSDQDEAYSPSNPAAICLPAPGSTDCGKIGGGFTADIVYLQTATSTTNGFDMIVSWDPKVLRYVEFDQGGLPWATHNPFTGYFAIDNTAGTLHVGQVIVGTNLVLTGDLVFFRLRFDVVGVGNTPLTISADTITNPNAVPHATVPGAFNSETFFDTTTGHTLNWAASFTNSAPINPGGSNSFQAMVSGGTPPYTYAWQFDSTNTGVFTVEAATNPAVVTLPSTFTGIRITLRVTDSATPTAHVIFLTQHIPFTLNVQQPGTPAGTVTVSSSNTFNGFWLGGLPNYSGSWRFCPGLAIQTAVCSQPVSSIASMSAQTSAVTQIYHFAGVYTNTLKIVETEPPSIYAGGVTSTFPFITTVTGTPLAYTLQLSSSATSFTLNVPVQFTATATYDSTYPSALRASTISVAFSFGDGGAFTQALSIGASGTGSTTVSHNYVSAGTHGAIAVGTDSSISSIQETSNTVVENSPDFSLSSPSPGALTVVQGSTSPSSSISATVTTSTTGSVTFSAPGLPTGVTATFMNSPCTPNPTCTAKVSFSATPTADTGSTTLTITATSSGGATHNKFISLTVNPTPFDFSLGAPSPSTVTVVQGSTSPTSSIAATIISGASVPLTLSTSTLPTGVTATFTNNLCSPTCTITVSFSATATAVTGTTTVTITAIGGGVTHTAALSLVVAAPPAFDFSLSTPSPTSLTVVQGSKSPSSSIIVTLLSGTTTPVTLTVSGLPTGVTATFSNNPCSPTCTVTVSFTATASAAVGTITVSIDAAGGGASHSTSLSLTISAATGGGPSFTATLTSPPSLAGVALVIVLIIAGLAYLRSRRKKPVV